MIHSSERTAPLATPSDVLAKFRWSITRLAAVLGAVHASLRKVEVAHGLRCNRALFSAEDCRDTGMDPSDATEIAAWQPDLPFFMQSGFGQK